MDPDRNSLIFDAGDDDFESAVVERSKESPVVVDFWAEWCGPCKMLSPVLDELAGEKGDTVKICKVDVQEQQALASQFGVGQPIVAPPDTNSPPFNILDYARTAEQIATMAQQLNTLLGGYEQFSEFDDRERRLIEPLRTLRMVRHSAWLAGSVRTARSRPRTTKST